MAERMINMATSFRGARDSLLYERICSRNQWIIHFNLNGACPSEICPEVGSPNGMGKLSTGEGRMGRDATITMTRIWGMA